MAEITFLGKTTFRNQEKKFGIKPDDRRRHVYVIGKTGMGKTVLMENMARQDIQKGRGIAFVDPHGEAAEGLLDFVPSSRINDVVYFNPADLDFPIAFNVMEKVDFRFRHLVASGLMAVFKKVWPDVWSARMEYILNNSILALLEYPESTLLGVNRMLADPEYRGKVVEKITDPVVKSFWVNEYARYTQKYEVEATAAIQNKVGQFVSNPLIRNSIGQVKSTLDIRKIMDEGKILIINLSKGRIGEDNSRLLGALLITKMQLAAMSRVDIPEEDRKDFYLYVDEFQNFATISFASILSEARKYRLNLTLGHQYITQMEEEVRDAVFGNVGTMVVFRIGAEDADFLEREFEPEFMATDLVGLTKYNIYLKLMIDGVAGRPFSAETLPPIKAEETSNREKIINASRERYGVRKEIVEEKIKRWTGFEDNAEHTLSATSQGNTPRPVMQGGFGGQEQSHLFDAVCSMCNKKTKVIFEPEKGRPIYCKNCLKKVKPRSEVVAPVASGKPQDGVTTAEKITSEVRPEAHVEKQEVRQDIKPPAVSLREAMHQEVVSFSPHRDSHDKDKVKRKEVDVSELRKAIKESLAEENDKPEPAKKNINNNPNPVVEKEPVPIPEKVSNDGSKRGVINPGEVVKF